MKRERLIQGLAVACILFFLIKKIAFSLNEPPLILAFAVSVWTLFLVGLLSDPRKWGLWVGTFGFLATVIQIILWRLALANQQSLGLQIDPSWINFLISLLPLLIGSVCSVSLRWVQPNPSPEIK